MTDMLRSLQASRATTLADMAEVDAEVNAAGSLENYARKTQTLV